MKSNHEKIKLLACAVLFLLAASSVWAQSAAGVAAISGAVRDASGAAVPNAKVVISSETHGELRTIETNSAGLFAAPALIPGPGYKVTVTASGFATWEVKDVDLRVGQDLKLTANLAIAQSATQVEVVGATPLVDSTKTDVSQVVGTREIQDLPINGRRVDSFVLNTPGVTNDATFGLLTFRGVAGNNSFLLDGNDNTEQFYGENAGRTRISVAGLRPTPSRNLRLSPRTSPPNTAAPWEAWSTPSPRAAATTFMASAFLPALSPASTRTILSPPSTPPSTASRPAGNSRRRDHQEQAVLLPLDRHHAPQFPLRR